MICLEFSCEAKTALTKKIGQDWQEVNEKQVIDNPAALKHILNEKINTLKYKLFHSET